MKFRLTSALAGLLVGLILAGGACTPIDNDPVRPVSFETIDKGFSSGIEIEEQIVIERVADWEALWTEHMALRSPVPELPELNFTRVTVIAIFSGLKSTGGYAVEIKEIATTNSEINVIYKVTEPGPDDMVTEAETQPFHIIKIERGAPLPVVFSREIEEP